MENLKEIVEEGRKLSEKRTWLSKGYVDLLGKINDELGKIPDMPEKRISYLLREYTYEPSNYESYKRKIRCNLVFDGDAFLEMELLKETQSDWEKETIAFPTIETIRAFARKFPEMLDFFLSEINKLNMVNQEAIETITSLIAKLQ